MSVYYTFVSFFLFLKNKIFFICFLLGFLCVYCMGFFFFYFFFIFFFFLWLLFFGVFLGGSRVS